MPRKRKPRSRRHIDKLVRGDRHSHRRHRGASRQPQRDARRYGSIARYQRNFRANCTWRAVVDVLVIAPAVPESPVRFVAVGGVNTIRLGVLKLARFKILKISARNCTLKRSRSAVSFSKEKSQVASPGPIEASSDVSKEAAGGRRRDERGWIEPLARLSQHHTAFEVRIQERPHGISRVAGIRRVVTELRRKGKTRSGGDNAGERPSAKPFFQRPRPLAYAWPRPNGSA